ncbi:MAG: SprB repeat-containing protein [Saprospiraceae bacterium]|nr:SprB repeat-containing protein [Saprospiraceae bacterium]
MEITENILPLALEINEINSIKCNGNADASITVQVSGGKAPFQYQWNDTKLNGENPKGLAAGDYQITVTDAAGNKANANISIKSPEALSASIQVQ